MNPILIVHQDKTTRKTLRDILEGERIPTEEVSTGEEGLERLLEEDFSCAIFPSGLPQAEILEILDKMQKAEVTAPLLLISGKGKEGKISDTLHRRCFDIIQNPVDPQVLLKSIRFAIHKNVLLSEIKVLRRKAGHIRELFGDSPAVQKIRETIHRVAPTEARILITGEEGTGKDLVARWIHEKSNRSKSPFVHIHCADIPQDMLGSELFGHEKGALPAAMKQRTGKLEEAQGGVLHIEDIDALPEDLQKKLHHTLQNGKMTRIGGDAEIPVDIRLVASTKADLTRSIEEGEFMADLYARISNVIIHIPSLNERAEDIPLLAEKFAREICEDMGIPRKTILPKALDELRSMKWSGNIRELRNVIERLVIMGGSKITEQDVKQYVTNITAKETPTDLFESFDRFQDFKDHIEKLFIEHKLRRYNWNVSKTAEVLDIQRSHLYNKIEKFNLRRMD